MSVEWFMYIFVAHLHILIFQARKQIAEVIPKLSTRVSIFWMKVNLVDS